jgi:DNA-directed RNA polymerase II subunit RPB1
MYIVRCSPLFLGRLDVFPVATFSDPSVLEDQIYPALIHISVCGVDRIQNIFFLRTTTTPVEWYLETDGSNLEEILNLPFVDSYRTYSNDIWEIYNLFGIEAVRAYIVEELTQLMPTIHRTHITLLADRMTVSGRLRSISRYTRKHEHSSVLSKATFEETLSGFLRSGMMNEVDTVNGSSASIICGRIPKVGTGLNDLML